MNAPQDAGDEEKVTEPGLKRWRADWWDFYPLLEYPRRPIQWSLSSVIFTAHPTQPVITARHFSSSKQFVLQSPPPVVSSPASYDPPSVISVSPSDQWLFAYFPRRDNDGTGCLWKRGAEIDNWQVKEYWSFAKDGGVVTASWLASPREWAADPSGIPIRLPLRGPNTPVSNPTLLLVTQDNNIQLIYLRYITPGIRTIKRSLSVPGTTAELPQNSNPADTFENANGTRQCIHAAICTGFNEPSIFVATQSRRMPSSSSPTISATPFNSMDLSVPVNLNFSPPGQKPAEWETWGEEHIIELFEIQLRFDGVYMALGVNALSTLNVANMPLTGLTFICTPPPPPPLLPASERPPSLRSRNPSEKGKIYLALTCVDFHEYNSLPTSKLTFYSLTQRPLIGNGARASVWNTNREATRTIDHGVVAYIEPFIDSLAPNQASIYVYILNNSGTLVQVKSRTKEASIGSVTVLNVPDLTDNSAFEPTTINHSSDSLGRNLPLFAAASPNHGLLCTLSSSLWCSQTAMHPLPKRPTSDTSNIPYTSLALATAILGRISTTDLVHSISSPKVPLSEATDIMYQALHILENYNSGLPYSSTWEIMGVATEVYRTRAQLLRDEKEADLLRDRWQTAHDVCSLAACNIAFEDCKEEDGYELEAAWRIIGLCTWVVNFTDKLMKACVLSSNVNIVKSEIPQPQSSDSSSLALPILLHLAHPFALQNFLAALKHIHAFRTFLGSLPAGGENPHMAQVILVDTVDCSGVDLGDLISLLEESLYPVRELDAHECQMALAACQPTPAMQPQLAQLIQKISQSETILNKSVLFIKPLDLVDGVAHLSVDTHPKSDEKDVITKGPLLKQGPRDLCLRCGGKTAGSKDVTRVIGLEAPKWILWESMWQIRCICGGPWLSASVH